MPERLHRHLATSYDQKQHGCSGDSEDLVKSAAALVTAFGFDLRPAQAAARELKISRTTETHSICPYCAVACGVIIHTLGDKAAT